MLSTVRRNLEEEMKVEHDHELRSGRCGSLRNFRRGHMRLVLRRAVSTGYPFERRRHAFRYPEAVTGRFH